MFIEHPFNNRMVSVVYPALFFTSQSAISWTLARCHGRLEYIAYTNRFLPAPTQETLLPTSIIRYMHRSAALTPLLAQAFVLTRGTTHYRTEDRGETWRSFEMPVSPSYVARPLSFHSDPSKYGYIIYQGTKCEREGGWSSICHDEVCLACPSKHRVFLTAGHRHTIPRRRSQINRKYSYMRLRSAPLPIVQKISSTTRTLI
jgi:Sortilin, neurotensin receptor 3,